MHSLTPGEAGCIFDADEGPGVAGEGETAVDRILNHVGRVSAASAVARVYKRAEQLQQRAKALDG